MKNTRKENKKMNKKEQAMLSIAREIVFSEAGERIPSIIEYSQKYNISVGLIQKAFMSLQEEGAVEIERRFLKRYGRKLPKNKIDNVEDISKMMDLYMELLKEKFETAKRTRKYDVSNGEMELDKIKGKWTSKELEEYIREINKAMRVK